MADGQVNAVQRAKADRYYMKELNELVGALVRDGAAALLDVVGILKTMSSPGSFAVGVAGQLANFYTHFSGVAANFPKLFAPLLKNNPGNLPRFMSLGLNFDNLNKQMVYNTM